MTPRVSMSAGAPQSMRAGIRMLAVALPVFWSMLQLYSWWTLPLNAVVFAVMLGVMAPRAMKRVKLKNIHFAALSFMAGSAVATVCAMLIENDTLPRVPGAALFAVGVAASVWVRRFGTAWKAAGTLFSIPFMAILIHPLPIGISAGFFGWYLVAAAVAFIWTAIIKAIENAPDMNEPETGPSVSSSDLKKPKLLPSTKMAVQLGVATAAAFALAELVDANNLVWPVLTVLIVHSSNRGRGDIILKGAQRTAGALIGVTIASLVAIDLAPRDSKEIVAIFAIIIFAAAVREYSYVFWAICIPAALVFLYSFFGQSGAEITTHLASRLIGIALGSAVGIASGYFLLPIRFTDVAKRRLGALLSVANDFTISAARGDIDHSALERLASADDELKQFDGTAKAARYFGFGVARRMNGAITGAHALVKELQDETTPRDAAVYAALAREIGAARRALSSSAAPDETIGTILKLIERA